MTTIDLIANDKKVLLYRKELNPISGGVNQTLLLCQMIYWANKNNYEPFYKFKEPCEHRLYIEGDSWCEELGFTRSQFDTAIKDLKERELVNWKTNIQRVTYYTLNIELLQKLLDGLNTIKNTNNQGGNNDLRKAENYTLGKSENPIYVQQKSHFSIKNNNLITENTTEINNTDIFNKKNKQKKENFEEKKLAKEIEDIFSLSKEKEKPKKLNEQEKIKNDILALTPDEIKQEEIFKIKPKAKNFLDEFNALEIPNELKEQWLNFKANKGKITAKSIQKDINALKANLSNAKQIITQSITNGWFGLYELSMKQTKANNYKSQQQAKVVDYSWETSRKEMLEIFNMDIGDKPKGWDDSVNYLQSEFSDVQAPAIPF